MADVNRGNRPLSPHLSVYRPQWTSVLSICHRITGVGLTLGAGLVVWWLLAAATGEDYFEFVDGILTSWLGHLVLLGLTFWVLLIMWDRGLNNHLDTISGRGCSSTLRWPFGIEIGKCGEKFQNRFQYAALWVGVNLLILVNIELILRQLITLLGGGDRLMNLQPDEEIAGAS